MKKIFYILTAAIVALGAVACDNQNLDNATPAGEGLTITASLEDIDRVAVDENNFTAAWELTDKITIGTYTFSQEELGVFKCNAEGVETLINQEVSATCGTFDSTQGLKGVEFGAKGTILATGTTLAFAPVNALLTVTAEADNTVLKSTAFSGDVTLVKGELTHIPALAGNATITYYVDGVECKSLSKTFEAAKHYTLGTLAAPAPVASEYGVVGSFQAPTTWDVAAPVVMYVEGDWVVAKGVELYKDDEFKIVKGKSWSVSYGLSAPGVLALDSEVTITSSNSQNMKAAKNGKFDIYFNATAKKIKYTCVEEYTDLKVNITIDNKAKWSPLYITLKNGSTTIVDKATVSGNVYAVSADYIGQSLSYTLTTSDASKKSEGNVTIGRTGATIELEEVAVETTIVFKHVEANQQQYWGNTTKIYIWGSGSSLDTAWPGNTMTKVSGVNYTWMIKVPSSLVGKTINCIINNGGSWKSPDYKLTIKEGENLLTDKMMGIK